MLLNIFSISKAILKRTVSILMIFVLLTTMMSSATLINPLAINGQGVGLPHSILLKAPNNSRINVINSQSKTPTNTSTTVAETKLRSGHISMLATATPAGRVEFLGQTYTRALHVPTVETARYQTIFLFHQRDHLAFVLAKKEAQSIISRVKIITQQHHGFFQQPRLMTESQQDSSSPVSNLSSAGFASSSATSPPTPPITLTRINASASSRTSDLSSNSAWMSELTPGFDGLAQSQAGFNGNTYFPPDVPLAVGPTYVVQMVNLAGEIFTKRGSPVLTFSLPTFFKVVGVSDRMSDPRILYDSISGRWFASLGDGTTNDVRVAVSTTNDPTGVWNIYRFQFSNCPDQPGIGMNDDKFAISANIFSSTCNGSFDGVQYYIINKNDMINGVSIPRSVVTVPDTSIFSLYPVQSQSSSSKLYMVSVGEDQTNSITLYTFTGTVGGSSSNSITTGVVSLPIQTTHIPPGALQPGTTTTLDTGDARVENAVWYQGKMWVGFNDACRPPGDTLTRACIRFDQIDTTTNNVLQDFDQGDIGVYYFYPGLQIDGRGNLDYIYGYSSTSTYPSLAASGKEGDSNTDTFLQPISLKLGSADDFSGRYGDYFEGAVDPSNSSIVWVAGEYHFSPGWSTFISAIYQQLGTSTTSTTNATSHPTSLTLNPLPTSVMAWGEPFTITGKLTDSNSSGIGIGGETISFTGTGAPNFANVVTRSDGTFTGKGTSAQSVSSEWTIQANFAGDSRYKLSHSNILNYTTTPHITTLQLNSIGNVPWDSASTITGRLLDNNDDKGVGGELITFTGTGTTNLTSVSTKNDGTFESTVLAPSSLKTDITLQAHFGGSSLYHAVDSNVVRYSTVKHVTFLSLTISPISVPQLGSYSVSGRLIDTSISNPLGGKTVIFTATPPITVNSVTTNSQGLYAISGLQAPNATNMYSIQAHYAGDILYNSAESSHETLTVTSASSGSHSPPPPHFPPPLILPPFPPVTIPPIIITPISNLNSSILQNLSGTVRSHVYEQIQTLLQYYQHLRSQEQQQLQQQLEKYLFQIHQYQRYQTSNSVYGLRAGTESRPNGSSLEANSSTLAYQRQGIYQPVQPPHPEKAYHREIGGQPFHQQPGPFNELNHLYPREQQQIQNQQYQSQLPQSHRPYKNQQPPIANAGISQTVNGGTIVTLDGRASYDPDNYVTAADSSGTRYITNNGIVTYQWAQVQTPGPTGALPIAVILKGANTANPTFEAPVVPHDVILVFSLKVVDRDEGAISSNSGIVYVMVKSNPIVSNSQGILGGSSGASSTGGAIVNQQHRHEQRQISSGFTNNHMVIPP